MNELFVNVKVDREERPDVDALYMDAVQAMTGRGRLADDRLHDARRRTVSTAAPTTRRNRSSSCLTPSTAMATTVMGASGPFANRTYARTSTSS